MRASAKPRFAAAALVLLALAAALPVGAADYSLPPPTTGQPVEFEAEHFEYDRDEDRMHMLGDVKVWDSTWTIHAQELWLDMNTRVGKARGPLRVEDKLSIVEGSYGRFNFGTREGEVEKAAGYYAPWRIRSLSARTDARRDLWYRSARFTSCSENPMPDEGRGGPVPHYHFRASQVHVRPNKYFLARNVFFYLGKVPVFYTPVLWKSLSPKHTLRTKFSPGYDHRNGAFLRTTTLYSPADSVQGKVFIDYFARPGLGLGNQLQYKASEEARGALYLYAIRDRTRDNFLTSGEPKKVERWGLIGDHYQTLPSSFSFQGRLQGQSDPTFHNDYTRNNAFRVTQQLVNSMALVRTTARTTTRLSFQRVDDADPQFPHDKFVRVSESSPRLDFQTAPLAVRHLPILNVFRASADNNYDRNRGFQQRTVGGGWEGTKSILLGGGFVFTPRVAFDENFIDRQVTFLDSGSTDTVRNAMVGHYDGGGTLRLRSPLGDTDFTQAFRRRLKPDAFENDAWANDHGIETNAFSVAHALRPARSIFTRFETGYDFRTFRDHTVGFRERVQPFIADVVVALRRGWDLTIHDDYQLREGNRTFLAQADWGERKGRFVSFGFASSPPITLTQKPPNDHYYVSQEAGWGPADGSWVLAGALRTDVTMASRARFQTAQLFEKELSLRREFHDFHTLFMLRVRPGGVKEFRFSVTLRLEKPDVWRKQVYTDYAGDR